MAFNRILNPNNLDGTDGFIIKGAVAKPMDTITRINHGDAAGRSVSNIGDFNGDGFDDLLIGAPGVRDYDRIGASYVIFGGSADFSSVLELASLDTNSGLVISNLNDFHLGEFGSSVSAAGDVNGDGIADIIIGAPNSYVDGESNVGLSYVVFGSSTGFGSAHLDLSSLDGTNGFVINGIDGSGKEPSFIQNVPIHFHVPGDEAGFSVSGVGDINNDGFDDVLIGAPNADPGDATPNDTLSGDNNNVNAGESYVVFGGNSFSSSLELSDIDGSNGFVITGVNSGRSGFSVSDAGDINGDGVADMVIGAPDAGEAYVVFGKDGSFGDSLDLSALDGANGFALKGGKGQGHSVSSAGDVNGDGLDDLIIGVDDLRAIKSLPIRNIDNPTESYVVFGSKAKFSSSLDLSSLDGSDGFVVTGENSIGYAVSGVGDINGDGFADIALSGRFYDTWVGLLEYDGKWGGSRNGYVIFGDSDLGSTGSVDPSTLNGANGFILENLGDIEDSIGYGFFVYSSLSTAGDINGDGVDDLAIGVESFEFGPYTGEGETYIIFGQNVANDAPTGSATASLANGAKDTPYLLTETDLLQGFSDVDRGDILSVENLTATNGAIVDNNDGTFTLTPEPNFSGVVSLAYTVSDGNGGAIAATQSLTIEDLGPMTFVFDAPTGIETITGFDVTEDVLQVKIAEFYNQSGAVSFDYTHSGTDLTLSAAGHPFALLENIESSEAAGVFKQLQFVGTIDTTGSNGVDILIGNDNNNTVKAAKGHDYIDGGAGNDALFGARGNDILLGGDGNDILNGRKDDDLLIGGHGADKFVFDKDSGGGTDRILDFNHNEGDRIVINQSALGIRDLNHLTFDAMTGELFAADHADAIALLENQSGFTVNNSVALI